MVYSNLPTILVKNIFPCYKLTQYSTFSGNAWYLEGVTVYDMHDKRIYEFACQQWLSGADGDKKTYRDLEVDRERGFIQGVEDIQELTDDELINFICYPAPD